MPEQNLVEVSFEIVSSVPTSGIIPHRFYLVKASGEVTGELYKGDMSGTTCIPIGIPKAELPSLISNILQNNPNLVKDNTAEVVSTVIALRGHPTSGDKKLPIVVLGGAAENDGQGGVYYWDNFSILEDNGSSVVMPSSRDSGTPGRFLRLNMGSSSGVTSSQVSVMIQEAITSLNLGDMAFRNLIVSTTPPDNSVGNNGDLWFQTQS